MHYNLIEIYKKIYPTKQLSLFEIQFILLKKVEESKPDKNILTFKRLQKVTRYIIVLLVIYFTVLTILNM